MASIFDLALGYGQWQGSGRNANLPRGAAAAAEVCARFAPMAVVPISDAAGDAHGVRRWNAIFDQFLAAQAILAEHRPRRLLTAGGDCAIDMAPVAYLNSVHSGLTVIWIDAHLDANTPATTPSGHLHGMPVSAIMGHAPEPMRQRMGVPVDPSRFYYHGIRAQGDEGDLAFMRDYALQTLDLEAIPTGPIHIHFDLDVLDPVEFPHLAYAEAGGLKIADALALVRRIAEGADLVGLTITEFAPVNDDAARDGARVIAEICAAAGGN